MFGSGVLQPVGVFGGERELLPQNNCTRSPRTAIVAVWCAQVRLKCTIFGFTFSDRASALTRRGEEKGRGGRVGKMAHVDDDDEVRMMCTAA